MGEAGRRGTFEQRKAKAVIRNKEKMTRALERAEKAKANLSNVMLSFMAFAKQSGLSVKEVTRRLKRHNKKSI